MEIFFRFPLNNILHNLLLPFIQKVVERNMGLRMSLLGENLSFVDKVMQIIAQDSREARELRGHAVAVANLLKETAAADDELAAVLAQKRDWNDFVAGPLAELNAVKPKRYFMHFMYSADLSRLRSPRCNLVEVRVY